MISRVREYLSILGGQSTPRKRRQRPQKPPKPPRGYKPGKGAK